MTFPLIKTPSSAKIGLDRGTKASARTSLVAATMAEAMASAIMSAPSNKPSIGMLVAVETSSFSVTKPLQKSVITLRQDWNFSLA